MKFLLVLLTASCLLAAGCETQTVSSPQDPAPNANGASAPSVAGQAAPPAGEVPFPQWAAHVPIAGDQVVLSPDNTQIEFLAAHLPPRDPEPRLGGFGRFTGALRFGPTKGELTSVSVDIETESIWTQVGGNLTDHLRSEDFFAVQEFPSLTFVSTSVTPASRAGSFQVKGNLTLHGVTREIAFPVVVDADEAGIRLASAFEIDRTEFDMTYARDSQSKGVALSVIVAQGAVEGEASRGAGFEPAWVFAWRDADGDGQLSADEAWKWMQEVFERIDTDADGAVSLDELQATVRPRGGRFGRRRGRQGQQ